MGKIVERIVLSTEERETLEGWVRASSSEQRLVERAQIVLLAAEGCSDAEIGRRLAVVYQTAGKWRKRFRDGDLAALGDAPRLGRTGGLWP